MKHSKMICLVLALMLVLLLEPTFIYATDATDTDAADDVVVDDYQVTASENEDECEHSWYYSWDEYCQRCEYCDATIPHNWGEPVRYNGNCQERRYIANTCIDCGMFDIRYGSYGPHKWSKTGWIGIGEGFDRYGQECSICWADRLVPITVKKGKTKRIIPKSDIKGAIKKKVHYNKKKVKATKNGKVKGKKRGATAKVIWDYKFRAYGETWWESYEVLIKVK